PQVARRGQLAEALRRAAHRGAQDRRNQVVLVIEVVEQHPVAGAEGPGQGPEAEPDQAVLERIVGRRLGELLTACGHRHTLSASIRWIRECSKRYTRSCSKCYTHRESDDRVEPVR